MKPYRDKFKKLHPDAGTKLAPEWQELEAVKTDLDQVMDGLDEKLNQVLHQQEYDYLQGYNIFVKKKEKKLLELIEALHRKYENSTDKDERINAMEAKISQLRDEQVQMQNENLKMRKQLVE
jgi:hypothetical protein